MLIFKTPLSQPRRCIILCSNYPNDHEDTELVVISPDTDVVLSLLVYTSWLISTTLFSLKLRTEMVISPQFISNNLTLTTIYLTLQKFIKHICQNNYNSQELAFHAVRGSVMSGRGPNIVAKYSRILIRGCCNAKIIDASARFVMLTICPRIHALSWNSTCVYVVLVKNVHKNKCDPLLPLIKMERS